MAILAVIVRIPRRAWISFVLLAASAGVVVYLRTGTDSLHSPQRRQWRDNAIAAINSRVADPKWINAEVQKLKPAIAATRPSGSMGKWVGDELLLMNNGEWIICQNVCRKSRAHIDDLFIGRGSDGRWYHSTFHFCVGKDVLMIEPPPDSLGHFVSMYWLVPFTPPSDDCLRVTWTPSDPYGEEKVPSTRPR